ncbi:hypothetical protein LSH36_501g00003 [Paralvinella palmiformis]|uniref:Uncharacterized protein n=1 Tax=Paralvinella palmiformis TaxID=53620 RepID=A0AAD9J8U1_9ANNE|nr:hypothetical protein LSH36_501g00003 [Paralvinella palmiformis]
MGVGSILQDNNAWPHTARIVLEDLQHRGIQRMQWPSCSPARGSFWQQSTMPPLCKISDRLLWMSGMRYHSSVFSSSYPAWGGGAKLLLLCLVAPHTTYVANVLNKS